MACGVLWQSPCAIWGQPRLLFSYNDRQKANHTQSLIFEELHDFWHVLNSSKEHWMISDIAGDKEGYISDIMNHWILDMNRKKSRLNKGGEEQKNSTEKLSKDWRTMCLSSISFQSAGKPASGRKKREKCGKVTLDGVVRGICRRRTFWKVVGRSR